MSARGNVTVNDYLKKSFSHHHLLMLVWIVVFGVALLWLLRPAPPIPTPSGWQKWSDTGAIYTLVAYKNGVLTGGVKGLWYSDGNSTVPLKSSDLPQGIVVTTLLNTADRGLWVGHSEGLSILYKEQWQHWSRSDGLPKAPIQSIALDQKGDEKGGYIAGMDSLIRFDGIIPNRKINGKQILPSSDFPIRRVSNLLLDSKNNLWIGTNEAPKGGVLLLANDNLRLWSHKSGLPHPQVTSMIEDQKGCIWVGTGFHKHGGAAIFENTPQGWRLQSTLVEAQLAGPKVRSLAQDREGNYWIGSENNGLAIRDENRVISILRKKEGLIGLEVTKTLQTKDGSIWLATLKGLMRIDTKALSKLLSSHRITK